MKDITELARKLATQPYLLVAFPDHAIDGETLYVARNPALEGCAAQGTSISEARENLAEFRILYFQHLLEHGLPVPPPDVARTNAVVIEFSAAGSEFDAQADHGNSEQAALLHQSEYM
jgi:predicted RNase H-like HicB family nuclease